MTGLVHNSKSSINRDANLGIFSFLLILFFVFGTIPARAQIDISDIAIRSNRSVGGTNRPTFSNSNPSGINSPNEENNDTLQDNAPKGIEYHVETPDSVLQASVFSFQHLPLDVKIMDFDHPSLSPTGAQFYDRVDGLNGNYYLYAGEMGHPHLAIYQNFDGSLGLNFRPNTFPCFYKTPDNVTFYQVQHPFTLLSYNSSLDKDYQLHVTHTQNITSRWNYALDYHLYSPEGVFTNDGATDHLLDFNTNYYSRDARYQLYAGAIWQRMSLNENGGISDDDVYIRQRVSRPSGIPVNFTNGGSITSDLTLYAHQSFNTVRQFEWYREIKKTIFDTIAGDTTWALNESGDSIPTFSRTIKPHDTIVGFDTIQPHTPHTFNTGVFALDLQWDRQNYRYIDSTRYNLLTGRLFWTNDAYLDHRWCNPFKLSLGIRPQIERLELRDSLNTSQTNTMLYPFARLVLSTHFAELTLGGEMGIGDGESRLTADLLFPFRDSIGQSDKTLRLSAVFQQASPALLYSICNASANDIRNVGLMKAEASFQNKWLDISLVANHISNNIWLDSTLHTCQTSGSALLLQGRINMNLQICSWLHFDMQQLVQYSSDQNQVRVPLFASKNSLYTDFYLFHRALHTQVGVDLRYHTSFYADAYDPGLGAFYRQNQISIGNYLWGDVFINLQIKRATIYAKAGHLNSLLENESHSFLLPHYPGIPFGLFYGITWRFFD